MLKDEEGDVVLDDYDAERGDAIVEEDAVPLKDIGQHAREQDFSTNAEIINATPVITMDIPAVDVIELLNTETSGEDLRNTLAGMALMINRLVFENRYLVRELHNLKSNPTQSGAHRFDMLHFKKINIINSYDFNGSDDIPACNLNSLVDNFDQNSTRRNDTAINVLRRFVKYLLENIIPNKVHSKYTIRERGGYDHLVELPMELTSFIKDICLETVGLFNPRTDEDRERREELGEIVYKFMKFALQELRRTPRKAKVPVARPPIEE